MATAFFGTLMELHTPYGRTHHGEMHREELEQRPQRLWEKWFMHYSSLHRILLVGEGDFSFSSTLATRLERAANIVATSLDSQEKVIRLYKSAMSSIINLKERGACVLHGVDATRMDQLEEFRGKCFDRIVFNFPHAGFWGKENDPEVLKKHRDLMSMFFRSASMLLANNGQIHVTHKRGEPYDRWNLAEEALKCGLFLSQCVDFKIRDYPGYNNKRGDGARIDESFALGQCKTYMFMLTYGAFIEKELLLTRRESLFSPLKRRYENVGEEEEYRHVQRLRIENFGEEEEYRRVQRQRLRIENFGEEEEYRHVKRQRIESTYNNRLMGVPGIHFNVPVATFPSDPTVPLPHANDFVMPRVVPREMRERKMFGIPLPNLNLPSWLRF
ncbi:hypothetical protein SUGI_0086550 [Cryptomeria japonica]|uniref:heavy metal-associated isoprenylated plant protein 41 n=1 Tax=Cryptomeria japonica TaxID=3369 RepID=UPI002408DBFE|nr:heavy metal-associated isoprenylated plant protein 41 [Cryptomeria japonica]GLJ08326.1 hypothetical protein SUGI_0086550 [Cryptomeria japonica]